MLLVILIVNFIKIFIIHNFQGKQDILPYLSLYLYSYMRAYGNLTLKHGNWKLMNTKIIRNIINKSLYILNEYIHTLYNK